jgi:hypothetical protein
MHFDDLHRGRVEDNQELGRRVLVLERYWNIAGTNATVRTGSH